MGIQELFRDFEKTRLRGGAGMPGAPEHVTRGQFKRIMGMMKLNMPDTDLDVLCEAFAGKKDAIDGLGEFTGTREGGSHEQRRTNAILMASASQAAMTKLAVAHKGSEVGSIYFDRA